MEIRMRKGGPPACRGFGTGRQENNVRACLINYDKTQCTKPGVETPGCRWDAHIYCYMDNNFVLEPLTFMLLDPNSGACWDILRGR